MKNAGRKSDASSHSKKVVDLHKKELSKTGDQNLESKNHFQELVEMLPEAVFEAGLDLQLTYVNKRTIELTGYSEEDFAQGLNGLELLAPEDRGRARNYFRMRMKGEDPGTIEYKAMKKDGSTYPIFFHTNPILRNGKISGISGIIVDITERKQAEVALQESEQKLRDLLNNLDAGVVVHAADTSIKLNNSRASELLGLNDEQMKGKQAIDPEWKFLDESNTPMLFEEYPVNRIISSKKPIKNRLVGVIRAKNKDVVWLLVNGFPVLDHQGKIAEIIISFIDITEQKEAKEKAIAQKNKTQQYLDIADVILVSIDTSGIVQLINPKGCKILEYSEDEILGENWFDNFLPGRLKENVKEVAKKVYSGEIESVKYFENVILTKSGHERLIAWNNAVLKDDMGDIIGTLSSGEDITERRHSEQAIKESKERFDLAVNATRDGIYDWNLISNEIYYSPAWKSMLGYQDKELPNDFSIWEKLTTAKDVQRSWVMQTELINKERDRFEMEFKMKHKDGHFVDVLSRAEAFFDEEGKATRIVGTHVNISERKQAEKFREVLYNISNAVTVTATLEKLIRLIREELGKIIDTTNFYIALYDDKTDTLSLPFFAGEKDEFTSFSAGKTLTYYVIKTQKSLLATQEVKNKLKQAGEIELLGSDSQVWLGVPLKIEGEITGVIVVQSYTNANAYKESDLKMLEFVSDQVSISIDRKKVEEDLISALNKAKESDRLKSAFLAAMSHELRTPLAAIIGFSEIINEELLGIEDVLDYNKAIHSSGKHLLTIVEDIFNMTLIESGEIKLAKEVIELHSFVNNVFEIIKIEQQNTNKDHIALNLINPPEGTRLVVNTDPAKLKQILINLLKNALKFTLEGHINFGYKIEADLTHPMILFYIEDTGMGIPEEKRHIIFDVFRQVDESNTRTYGGTGIGLSIAKKLTFQLGGNIWFESEGEKGSTFYFTIPIEAGETYSKPKETESIKNIQLKGKTILVVEDIEYSFELLRITLEKTGIHTLWAKNGVEAIKICAENNTLDLVLMDINMPVMNGYEATREIKKIKPDLPIIAQTAYAIEGDREKSLEAGCNDYISKPLNNTDLLAMIKKHI